MADILPAIQPVSAHSEAAIRSPAPLLAVTAHGQMFAWNVAAESFGCVFI